MKLKNFKVEDLVWKVILPIDKKSRIHGKWSSNWEGPYEIKTVYSNKACSIHQVNFEI